MSPRHRLSKYVNDYWKGQFVEGKVTDGRDDDAVIGDVEHISEVIKRRRMSD